MSPPWHQFGSIIQTTFSIHGQPSNTPSLDQPLIACSSVISTKLIFFRNPQVGWAKFHFWLKACIIKLIVCNVTKMFIIHDIEIQPHNTQLLRTGLILSGINIVFGGFLTFPVKSISKYFQHSTIFGITSVTRI